MTTYYKVVRPDGRSFYDPTFRWVPESGGPIPDGGLLVSHPRHLDQRSAAGYLSVSTVPTDCTGMRWPCRLLEVVAVPRRKVITPEPERMPSKRAASAWLVIRELDPHLALGPQGREVAAIIDRAGRLTQEEAALLDAARSASAAEYSARLAAWDATEYAARNTAWSAAWSAAFAVWGAATATVVRDLISPADYQTLAGPWLSVIGETR